MLDARKTAELTRLIGEAELRRLPDRLMGQLATAFAPQADLAALTHESHVIVAMAGSLGFEDMAAACRTLEAAITTNTRLPDAVTEARRAQPPRGGLTPKGEGTSVARVSQTG